MDRGVHHGATSNPFGGRSALPLCGGSHAVQLCPQVRLAALQLRRPRRHRALRGEQPLCDVGEVGGALVGDWEQLSHTTKHDITQLRMH